ncbi:MAG: GspE/PulE family protein [Candidatus Saccharibacteria bacterium]
MFQERKTPGAVKNGAGNVHNKIKKSVPNTFLAPAQTSVIRHADHESPPLEHNYSNPNEMIPLGPFSISSDLLNLVTYDLAVNYRFVPVKRHGNDLNVAVAESFNNEDMDFLASELGCSLNPVLFRKSELNLAIRNYSKAYFRYKILTSLSTTNNPGIKNLHTQLDGAAEEAPIVQLMNYLLSQAVIMDASDIHIEPQNDSLRIRLRIDGGLIDLMNLPTEVAPAMISRIKIMSSLDISDRRQPQDGRIRAFINGDEIHLRVSTIPAVYGEKAVLRILNRLQKWMSIDKLGLEDYNLTRFFDLIKSSRGMILIAGPTGSGKTSTMYAMLDHLNNSDRNIITLEDPVECTIAGITQVQINNKSGLTFAKGLRSVLRQDPDIIMVGEIRDLETAELAIRAALTGHLVLSTIHTSSACGAVTRLVDMGIEPYLVAAALTGVISQRLVRRICPECKQHHMPVSEQVNRASGQASFYKGTGCEWCIDTGYQGRSALQEILVVDKELGAMISTRALENEIEERAIANGMIPLLEDGLSKARNGITTIEEVWKEACI